MHPFLALIFGGLTGGLIAGENVDAVLRSFSSGFGTTAAGVGVLIALGAMFAKLLADSGGADQIVDTIVGRASPRALPWAMAAVGAIIGLPMFFDVGLVLLMPFIYLVARRAQVSLITIGIPALAGLSAMHGLVPPHPGPLTAVDYLGADLGLTLGRGAGMSGREISKCIESSLPGISGMLLIVAAGGGFKQVLVDTGIGTLLAEWARGANASVLLLAWVLSVLIRLATGSATVATITASSRASPRARSPWSCSRSDPARCSSAM